MPMAIEAVCVGGCVSIVSSSVKKRRGYCKCCAARYEDSNVVSWGEEITCGCGGNTISMATAHKTPFKK